MISFEQDGEEHLLVANSAHGLIKIACSDIDAQSPLTEPKEPFQRHRDPKSPRRHGLANLNGGVKLELQADDDGHQHLRSLKTASL